MTGNFKSEKRESFHHKKSSQRLNSNIFTWIWAARESFFTRKQILFWRREICSKYRQTQKFLPF